MHRASVDPPSPAALLARICRRCIDTVAAMFARIARRRGWLAIGTALAVALSISVSCPRLGFFTGKDRLYLPSPEETIVIWPTIAEQARAPFSPDLALYSRPSAHVGKLAFRLTQPLLQRLLHIGMVGTLIVQALLGVLLLSLFGRIVEDLYGDRIAALAAVFALSAIFAGKAAFLELTGVGDAFAFGSFIIAAAFRAPPLVFAAIVTACFTDERAALAAPLVAVYWAVRDASSAERLAWTSPRTIAALAGWVAYGLARSALSQIYGMHTPVGDAYSVGPALIRQNLPALLTELPLALSGLWLIVALAAYRAARQGQWTLLAVTTLLAGIVVGAALSVYDVSRSLGYLLPLLLVAVAAAARFGVGQATARDAMILACTVSLLTSWPPSKTAAIASGPLPVEVARLIHLMRN